MPSSAGISVQFLRDVGHGGCEQQPVEVARELAAFIHAARESVDVAIYDFRLSDRLAATVVGALSDAVRRGLQVRIAYDAGKPVFAGAAAFTALQADPAPIGTGAWITSQLAETGVHFKPITGAPNLMHSKYVLRDPETSNAAVWAGSANFTDDAWTLQENNILQIRSAELARAYRQNFDALWDAGCVQHGTPHNYGHTLVDGVIVEWDFAPGDGSSIDLEFVERVDTAQQRIVLAAMILTSRALLAALADAVHLGLRLSGICDATLMRPIVQNWEQRHDRDLVRDWQVVSAHLSHKESRPYAPSWPHDFMHNKILVCDDTIMTGSYNFSPNAEHNAENQLRITDPLLAEQYCRHIAEITEAYRHPSSPRVAEHRPQLEVARHADTFCADEVFSRT